MRNKKTLIHLLLIFVLTINLNVKLTAQSRYYLKTDRAVNKIILENNETKKQVKLKPIYQKNVFIIPEADFENTVFLATEAIRIELFDKEKSLLAYVQLSENESIKLFLLLNNLNNPALELSEDIENGDFNLIDFLSSKKRHNSNLTPRGSVSFSSSSKAKICYVEDFSIAWHGGDDNQFEGVIISASSGDIIWRKEHLESPYLDYSTIKNDLFSPLQKGASYIFELVELSSSEVYTYEFTYLPLVFEDEIAFGNINNINFNWRSSVSVDMAQIINPATKEIIWEKKLLEKQSSLNVEEISEIGRKKLKIRTEYLFNITTETESFSRRFKIFFSEKKYNELDINNKK